MQRDWLLERRLAFWSAVCRWAKRRRDWELYELAGAARNALVRKGARRR